MNRLLFILLAIALCACSNKPSQADEDAVRKVVLDFVNDFNEGTFKKAETYASIDWEHINPGGGIDIGRQSALENLPAAHQSFLKDVSMTTDSMKVRFVSPGVALVVAYHSITPYVTPDSVQHENERQIKSYVIVRQHDKWLLTLDHNTIIR